MLFINYDFTHSHTVADGMCFFICFLFIKRTVYNILQFYRISTLFFVSFFFPCSFTSLVQRFINEDKLPHLLFYGPPGTGKTSTILACAKQLYKDKEFNSMVLEVQDKSSSRAFSILGCKLSLLCFTLGIFWEMWMTPLGLIFDQLCFAA